jgi:hypothetical protein
MHTQEDIANQLALLQSYRNTLAHYLQQQALLTVAFMPPSVAAGIQECRENISRIKKTLRGWGLQVEDMPDDDYPIEHVSSHINQYRERPEGILVISDIQLLPNREQKTCLVDFRVSNTGEADVVINRVVFEVLDIVEISTAGSMEFSKVYDLDISNLKKIGDRIECKVAQLIKPRESDRFGISLIARSLGTGVFRGWKLSPTLLTNYQDVQGEPFEIWLPYQELFSSLTEAKERLERIYGRPMERVRPDKHYDKMRVLLIDKHRGQKIKVELPSDVSIWELVPALASKLGLPSDAHYVIFHQGSGRKLDENDTLKSFGVQIEDTLEISVIGEEEYHSRIIRRRAEEFDDLAVNYDHVEVIIVSPEQQIRRAILPIDVPIHDLLPALTTRLQLPASSTYIMFHLETDKQLGDEDTLRILKVQPNDTLKILESI